MPKFFDIHAHLNFSAYDEDREETAKRAIDAGVFVMNVGTQKDTSKKAVELAEQYENMYAIVGLHPVHTGKSYHDEAELGEGGKAFTPTPISNNSTAKTVVVVGNVLGLDGNKSSEIGVSSYKERGFTSRGEDFDFEYYKELAKHPKVVAIGECGLDYFHLEEGSVEKQKNIFIKHIELANELGKPLMLHVRSSKDRSAYKEALEILKEHAQTPFNFHFFAGSLEEVNMILEAGGTFSFTGVITFAKDYEELVRSIPLDRMMSETDCPYVTPAPYRGKRNEPTYVIEVVKKIAEIRGEDFEKVRLSLVQNAVKFFSLKL